ncbi:MAG: LamG domain-containing protein [Propionibacteriales bacterium]|nr:LamG domain-containing protein [Propionibacteriales bacterium]
MRPGRIHGRFLTSAVALCSSILLVGFTGGSAEAASTVRGLWHLNEKSGSIAYDSSGKGNNGTNYGATIGVEGHLLTAYAFDSTNAHVLVPSSATLNPGRANFSYSAWVNFTVAPGSGQTYDIVRKGVTTTSGGEFKLEIYEGGRARCTAKDSAALLGVIQGPRTSLADGRWHQITCKRAGSTWSVTVDGQVRSKTVAFGSISNASALSIGSKYGTADGTPGRIDEVRLAIG